MFDCEEEAKKSKQGQFQWAQTRNEEEKIARQLSSQARSHPTKQFSSCFIGGL
jgi:hypothetical protein